MANLHFHGHATFTLTTDDGTRIMIDPFLSGSPVADIGVEDVEKLDYILCTHGHTDHFLDAIPLAKSTGATLVSTYEIVGFAQSQGVEAAHPLHIGGGFEFPFGRVKMTPALHGGQVHGDDGTFTTVPGGFLIEADGKRIYHAGDTALLMDMQLLKGKVDIAILPIGDNFTMGPEDAVTAVDFIEPEVVIPIHYDTFDVIRQDPLKFQAMVGDRARVQIMRSGDRFDC